MSVFYAWCSDVAQVDPVLSLIPGNPIRELAVWELSRCLRIKSGPGAVVGAVCRQKLTADLIYPTGVCINVTHVQLVRARQTNKYIDVVPADIIRTRPQTRSQALVKRRVITPTQNGYCTWWWLWWCWCRRTWQRRRWLLEWWCWWQWC